MADVILIFTGKRKSGKDYACQMLVDHLRNKPSRYAYRLITLSAPLKKAYALENNLDYEKLLDSSEYKELYRLDMIRWSDDKRAQDAAYFCRQAVEEAQSAIVDPSTINIWIVTDARRRTDLAYFEQHFPQRVKLIRVVADDSTRLQRNWKFTPGVDDSISECDLDNIPHWDFILTNNSRAQLETGARVLFSFLDELKK